MSGCNSLPATINHLQFDNQSARIYGLDLAGHYPLLENSSYGNVTATAMMSYVRGKNRDTNDDLYNIMPLNGRLAVQHQKGSWNNSVELELSIRRPGLQLLEMS